MTAAGAVSWASEKVSAIAEAMPPLHNKLAASASRATSWACEGGGSRCM